MTEHNTATNDLRTRHRRALWLRDAQALGCEMKRLYDEALALGDAHEARHLYAALNAGNSDPCEGGAICTLDAVPLVPGGRWGFR